MIRREGRLDNPPVDPRRKPGHENREPIVIHRWDQPIFVLALIVILVLGGIAGLNSLTALVR